MSFSSSAPKNTTATTTSLTTTNENISGNTGLTTIAKEGSSLNLSYAPVSINTDAGAVNAGAYVANAGISAATTIAANAFDASGKADEALRSLAALSVNRNADLASSSQNRAYDIIDATGKALLDAESQFGKQLGDFQLASQAQLGNVVSALSQSFVENNRSADQQVISAVSQSGEQLITGLTDSVKYVAIAAVVALFGFIAYRSAK